MSLPTGLIEDLRRSWRVFRHSPGLALVAVVALALGIGFTTTMFGIVHGATRDLPLAEPDELVVFAEHVPSERLEDLASRPYAIRYWAQTLTSLEGLGAFEQLSVNISRDHAHPERLSATAITPNSFALLQVMAARGRLFTDADTAAEHSNVVVIADSLWRSRFAGDESILGRVLWIDGQPRTVIGVMPPRFGFPINAQLWLPVQVSPTEGAAGGGQEFRVFGRLREGVSIDAAQRELDVAMSGLASSAPEVYRERRARVLPFTELETPADIRWTLRLLVAVVSLVLLVACANVANLLLARAAARSRETAIQTALGASRARLVTQQLAESVLLAGVAAIMALGIAHGGLKFFEAASREILTAFWVDLRIDPTVVAFATLMGLAAAAAAGLVPALRASAADVSELLKDPLTLSGLRMGKLGRWLVVAQIALACGLLVVTATFSRASAVLRAVDIPFPAHQILTAQLSVTQDVLNSQPARNQLFARLRDALDSSREFPVSALVSVFPGRGSGRWTFSMPGAATTQRLTTGVMIVTPEFFDLAEARAVSGRLFSWQDDERALLVAVVNQSFARRFLGNTDPLGQRVALGPRELTIVGVVRDLLIQDIEDLDGSGLYVPMLQARPFAVRVMARTAGSPLSSVPVLRRAVEGVDPDLPILEPASLYEAIYADKRILDALAILFMCFGLGAVFLALIGMYAVLSFVVTQQRREFGVRMALGATRRDIVTMVVKRGSRELAWGLGIGLVIAFVLSRVLASSLDRIPPADPLTFVAISATVLVGAALSLWRPVRQAVRLDPARALRSN